MSKSLEAISKLMKKKLNHTTTVSDKHSQSMLLTFSVFTETFMMYRIFK